MARSIVPGLLANLIVGVVEELGTALPHFAAYDLADAASRKLDAVYVRHALKTREDADALYDQLIVIAQGRNWDIKERRWETEGFPTETSQVRTFHQKARQDAYTRLWYRAAQQAEEMILERAQDEYEREVEQRYNGFAR